ncbi:hypothetical protein RB596_000081, partial [Gaeumannomyces avenae]
MVVQSRRPRRDRHTFHRKDEIISDATILRAVREVLDRLEIRLEATSQQPPLSRQGSRSSCRRASSSAAPGGRPSRPQIEQTNHPGSRPERQPGSRRRSVQRREPETATQHSPEQHHSPKRDCTPPSEPPPPPRQQNHPLAIDYQRSVLELRRSFGLMESQSDVSLGRPSSSHKDAAAANPRRQSFLELPAFTRLQDDLESVSVYSPYMAPSSLMN